MAAQPTEILDTHLHVWERRRFRYDWIAAGSPLDRDVTLAEVAPLLTAAHVGGGILVEAANDPAEIAWLLEVVAQATGDWGVIGWLDLEQAETLKALQQWAQVSHFKGVRLNWFAPRTLTRPLQAGLEVLAEQGLLLEILPHWEFLPQLGVWSQQYPQVRWVLEHFGGLAPTADHFAQWVTLMRPLADLPNLTLKLSGYLPATPHYIETAMQLFGEQRLLLGSNYPVYPQYDTWAHYWRTTLTPFDPAVQRAICAGNARRLYRL